MDSTATPESFYCHEAGCSNRRFKELNDLKQHCSKSGHPMPDPTMATTKPPTTHTNTKAAGTPSPEPKLGTPNRTSTWAAIAASKKAPGTSHEVIHLRDDSGSSWGTSGWDNDMMRQVTPPVTEPPSSPTANPQLEPSPEPAKDSEESESDDNWSEREEELGYHGPETDPQKYLALLRDAVHPVDLLREYKYVLAGEDTHCTPHFPATDFQETPDADRSAPWQQSKRDAVALDCEMVEVQVPGEPFGPVHSALARLTVIDALTKEVLIDALVGVAPYEVVDFKTRFSGITAEEYYPTLKRGPPAAFRDWKAARQALFRYVDKETVLVGHALHNDLRVLRVIHTRCVDSSVISREMRYVEEGRSRYFLYKLSKLVWALCGREIQRTTAERQGHCSLEDTLATMDVVRSLVENPDCFREWLQVDRYYRF